MRRYVLLLLLLPTVSWAHAQSVYEALLMRHAMPALTAECLVIPGTDRRETLAVAFRIPFPALTFLRTDEGFDAEAEVMVRVLDGDQTVAERTWHGAARAASFVETRGKDRWAEGLVTATLPPGRYRARVHLVGTEAAATTEVAVVASPEKAGIGAPLVARSVERPEGGGVSAALAVEGGALPFGDSALIVVPLHLPGGAVADSLRMRYELREAREGGRVVRSGRLEGGEIAAVGEPEDAGGAGAVLRWRPPAPGAVRFLAVIAPGDGLEDGKYFLDVQVSAGPLILSHRHILETRWTLMPVSLYDVDTAIKHLSFITGRDALRAMRRGSRQEREERLRAFWRRRDPTPATAYNELMAEYYGRIDYAAETFSTGRKPWPDGLETDRARVYVTQGPPLRTERAYPPEGGVQEIWHYPDGKRFIFHAESAQNPPVLQSE